MSSSNINTKWTDFESKCLVRADVLEFMGDSYTPVDERDIFDILAEITKSKQYYQDQSLENQSERQAPTK